jgi:hypothetical protein
MLPTTSARGIEAANRAAIYAEQRAADFDVRDIFDRASQVGFRAATIHAVARLVIVTVPPAVIEDAVPGLLTAENIANHIASILCDAAVEYSGIPLDDALTTMRGDGVAILTWDVR